MVTAVAGKVPGLTTTAVPRSEEPRRRDAGPARICAINQGFPNELAPPTTKPSSYLTLPAQLYNNAPSMTSIDPYMKLPTVHQWNLRFSRSCRVVLWSRRPMSATAGRA